MDRESGFYWVRFDEEWRVAEFIFLGVFGWAWLIPGSCNQYTDSDFSDIGPRIDEHGREGKTGRALEV